MIESAIIYIASKQITPFESNKAKSSIQLHEKTETTVFS